MALEFKIAKNKEEIEQALSLREVKETDEFDFLPVTTHFLALKDDQPVGSLRMTEYSEKGLPIEIVDLSKFRLPGKKIAKASKLFVKEEASCAGKTMLGLFKLAYRYAKDRNITDIYVTSNQKARPIFEKLCFKKIGSSNFYDRFNVLVTPMHLDIEKALEGFEKKNPLLSRCFND